MGTLFVDPGSLRAELSLQSAMATPDGMGGHVENWTEIATVFGRIEPVSAARYHGADQTMETVTHRITLRWRDGVAAGMRFAKGERVFDILTVHDPDDSGRYLVCRAREAGQ
jgi:SPP1 family predicted phage head-tail adaptor